MAPVNDYIKRAAESYRTQAQAYPHSVGIASAPVRTVPTTGVNANLTDRGYPDSKSGSAGLKPLEVRDLTTSNAKTPSTGSGSSGGSGGGTPTTNKRAFGAYMQLAAAQAAANENRAAQAAAAQRAAAQAAYDRGMATLTNAFNSRINGLSDNYNSTLGQLRSSYDNSSKNVNQDADNSLRQAYINRMMNEKGLNQQLSSQGISGGAAESTLAKLYNNYGNSRNNIENTRANNLSDLEQNFNTNQANALQAYNNAVADAEAQRAQYMMNLENALANNEIGISQNYQDALNSNTSSYLAALSDALDQMNKYGFTPTDVTNDINLASLIQQTMTPQSLYNRSNALGEADSGVNNYTLPSANIEALLRSLYGV